MTASSEATRAQLVALVGNPNVGKSTLFNALTGMQQKTANYPGVTVDTREGQLPGREVETRLLDLPGTYSLRPSAADEAIVEGVLLGREADPPDVTVVVLDTTNLRRNMFLLTEVVDLARPMVIVMNMVDEARRAGLDVPSDRLRKLLDVPVIETVASTGDGVDGLAKAIDEARPAQRPWRFEGELEQQLQACAGEHPWAKLRTLGEQQPDLREQEVLGRYTWITEALQASGITSEKLRERTEKLDRVLLHPVLGPIIFLFVMALVFQSIFAWATPLMDGIEGGFTWMQDGAGEVLPGVIGETATSLVRDGIIGGVGAVIVFLPQILILFFFIGLLEDTGYMSRAAFLVDRPLRAVGLSGRSFIPMLSSFACAIPGIMATRTIPNRFERLLAIAVAPLMTCSARLPVYAVLIAAFVPANTVLGFLGLQGLVLFGLYFAGLFAGLLLAFVASRRTKNRGRLLPLVVELPPYRRPALKGLMMKLRVRGGDFLKRAGTVIFAVAIVLWFLMAFPQQDPNPNLTPEEQQAVQLSESFAGRLGHAIEPVIEPLGYDWKMGVGLIASFAAREVFVGTMGVVYSMGEVDLEDEKQSQGLRSALQNETDPDTGEKVYTLATVFSLLAFYVFALQCGATVAVVKRETRSWKFALAQLFGFLVLAYVAAFVTYRVMLALGYG